MTGDYKASRWQCAYKLHCLMTPLDEHTRLFDVGQTTLSEKLRLQQPYMHIHI